MKHTIVYILIFCFGNILNGQAYFEYDDEINQIYKEIIKLNFKKAELDCKAYKTNHPQNLAILHIENYIDFFRIFITEEKAIFNQLENRKNLRIKQIESQAPKDSPYTDFVTAEINLQWALMRSKFNELFKAGREIINAYQLLTENQKKHPNFIYNKKSLSIIHALIETISLPGFIKGFFGIRGTIAQGTAEIKEVMEYAKAQPFIFEQEAEAIYAFIQFYQNNNKTEAWEAIKNSSLDPTESPLACFLMTKIAQRAGKNDAAIDILSKRPMTNQENQFIFLDFMMGLSKLRKLDPEAKQYFELYLNNFKGRHYIKEAYQKLAWYELMMNENIAGYKFYMEKVLSNGDDLIDDDKQANKEAKENKIPHPDLLSARVLFDGGYYNRAYNLLIKKSHLFFNSEDHNLEYNYRLGRITQSLKNYPAALQFYSTTIDKGVASKSYFACNAALQMGLIYESQKDPIKAAKYFELCLDQSPSDYKNSLHQKAKSGLNRIKS